MSLDRPPDAVRIRRGTVAALFAFDVGASIDLEACRSRCGDTTEAARIEHRQPAPSYLQFEPPPLRFVQKAAPAEVGGHATSSAVDLTLFDFGAVSVRYEIPFEGPLEGLVALARALHADPRLKADAERRVRDLATSVGDAISEANLAPLVEDYVIFRCEELEGATPESFVRDHAGDLARLLTPEEKTLSREEVEDIASHRVSYTPDDVTFVDWNAALVVGKEMEDVCEVLEFTTVQLLEVRHLDGRLDRSLDSAYDLLAGPRTSFRPRPTRAALARVGRLQVDGAILFERVTNALKLVGDQFLARVHRLATSRFRLEEWTSNIRRKLETIDGIYEKLSDRAAGRRMEILEWSIVVLFVLSIVVSVLLGSGH